MEDLHERVYETMELHEEKNRWRASALRLDQQLRMAIAWIDTEGRNCPSFSSVDGILRMIKDVK